MKSIIKLLMIFMLALLIVFGGNYIIGIKGYANISESKAVNAGVYPGNYDVEEEKEINSENGENEKIEKQEKVEEKINYVTMDKSEVKIPILMYHSISDDDPSNSLLVPINQFEEQIKWLAEEGFTPMLLEDVVQAFETGKVPEKPVAITFDDGYADNYTEAYRILKNYNMKATFFIITDNIDVDSYFMNSDMLKEMKDHGMGIENHTSIHIEFTAISREDKASIISDGAKALKDKAGVESKFLCYPVGRYDEETIEVAKELGIKAAVTTENGFATFSDGLHSLKRVRISPMDIEAFKSIFSDFIY